MIDTTQGVYHFLPFVRRGLSGALTSVDTLNAGQPSRAQLPVELTVNNDPIRLSTRVLGPGDVAGLDHSQIIRLSPIANASDYPPNFLVSVDFSSEDLPWMFTPLKAGQNERLRPWLVLVVVRQQPGVSLQPPSSSTSLPFLHLAPPVDVRRELPDLAESWAWAHAQVSGSPASGQSLLDHLAVNPHLGSSRLLSSQRLLPNSRYIACVVPAYQAGVNAGLGGRADIATLAPAWSLSELASEIQLPVYFHWEFGTGPRGDFESLARRLKPRTMGAGVGSRDVDVGQPGPGLPGITVDEPGRMLAFEGVLKVPGIVTPDWPDSARVPFEQQALKALDAFDDGVDDPVIGPVLAPPVYGRWHAAIDRLNTQESGWVRQLNLDPRYRAGAGLGSAVIRRDQETLMEEAWSQVGDVTAANQELRRAQLAREVAASLKRKHLDSLSDAHLVHVTRPIHRRLKLNVKSVYATVESTLSGGGALTGAIRRITRPRNAIRRRDAVKPWRSVALQLNAGSLVVTLPRTSPHGSTLIDNVQGGDANDTATGTAVRPLTSAMLTADRVAATANRPTFTVSHQIDQTPVLANATGARDSQDAALFRTSATMVLDQTQALVALGKTADSIAAELPSIRQLISDKLNPETSIRRRVFDRIKIPPDLWDPIDPLDPIMAYPVFPRPMYEALAELSAEHVLPGLDNIPPDTVTLLETNPPVIEAFMIGLNHEMASELLWREYPTDQRGSYFRQFWDPGIRFNQRLSTAAQQALTDIPEVHRFVLSNSLGSNMLGTSSNTLVLLLRGELLRRFPTAVIYAEQAQLSGAGNIEPNGTIRQPLFHGQLDPDVHFIGFDLASAAAIGSGTANDAGWYFVIQQQPTEPLFGLDVSPHFADTLPAAQQWDDLTWGHLTADANAAPVTQIVVDSTLPDTSQIADNNGVSWGTNAAHMAVALLQKPVKIAVHAKVMLASGDRNG